MQKIKESRSNPNIHVREISADAIRRDRVIDDFLVVDRNLGWSEQRQIGQVPHDDLLEILKIPEALEGSASTVAVRRYAKASAGDFA